RAKLRSLRDVDDGARLARFGIEHGHLTREAASQQGACQVMLRVARVHDYELAVKFDAVEAIIANALLALWRVQPCKGFWLNPVPSLGPGHPAFGSVPRHEPLGRGTVGHRLELV